MRDLVRHQRRNVLREFGNERTSVQHVQHRFCADALPELFQLAHAAPHLEKKIFGGQSCFSGRLRDEAGEVDAQIMSALLFL